MRAVWELVRLCWVCGWREGRVVGMFTVKAGNASGVSVCWRMEPSVCTISLSTGLVECGS